MLLISLFLLACSTDEDTVSVSGVGDVRRESVASPTPGNTNNEENIAPAVVQAIDETPPLDTISLDNVTDLTVIAQLPAHRGRIILAAFINDGTLLTMGVDGLLQAWSTTDWQVLNSVEIFSEAFVATVSSSGDVYAIGDASLLRRIDPLSGEILAEANLPLQPLSITTDGAGRVAVGFEEGLAQIYPPDLSGIEIEFTYGRPPNETNGIAFNRDGTRLVTGYPDSSIILWDTTTGERINRPSDHFRAVQVVQSAPDGQTFATGSSDNNIFIWDFEGPTIQQQLFGAHSRDVGGLVYFPSGDLLVSTGQDGTIRIWQLGPDSPNDAAFALTAGATNGDFWTRTPTISPNEQLVAFSDDDGRVTVLGVPSAE